VPRHLSHAAQGVRPGPHDARNRAAPALARGGLAGRRHDRPVRLRHAGRRVLGILQTGLLMRRTLLTLVLTGLVILPACNRTPEHARVDAALAPLLPGDTVAVACLRLDKLKTTPFYAKYVAGKKIPPLEELARATGVDLRENLWELYFTTNGATHYVFIRGKYGGEFDKEPDIKGEGLQKTDYKGHYLLSAGDHGVLFMNTGAAVASKVEDLKALIDGLDNPARKPPQAVLDMVATLPGTA